MSALVQFRLLAATNDVTLIGPPTATQFGADALNNSDTWLARPNALLLERLAWLTKPTDNDKNNNRH